MNNYIHIKQWDAIILPYPYFNGGLVKTTLLGHGWVMTPYIKLWVWLLILAQQINEKCCPGCIYRTLCQDELKCDAYKIAIYFSLLERSRWCYHFMMCRNDTRFYCNRLTLSNDSSKSKVWPKRKIQLPLAGSRKTLVAPFTNMV